MLVLLWRLLQAAFGRIRRVFYGWVVVGISVVILLIVWGCQYSFGVFFKPLISEFGWTRASTSLAYSLYMVIHGLTQPVTGIVADRWGPRVPLIICGVGMGIGYFLMSRVTELWQLYLYYGVVIAISMTFAFVPIASTVTRWFTARRGLALGITATGVG
ncbi:MAG: MFS transporter, partial [Chloroflexota bacterium]